VNCGLFSIHGHDQGAQPLLMSHVRVLCVRKTRRRCSQANSSFEKPAYLCVPNREGRVGPGAVQSGRQSIQFWIGGPLMGADGRALGGVLSTD
jgi:hypothetical protein